MGIQGLLPLLKSIMVPIHIKELEGCCVAVDTYSWLHKGALSCSKELCKGLPTSRHIQYCMHRVNLLRHYGVKPILVFDGGFLPMKIDQENKRARSRKENLARALEHEANGNFSAAYECYQKAVDISPSIAHDLIQVLKRENVSYVVAPYEADAQMTFLAITNQVDAVITEDSDLIPFGCPRIIFKMDKFGHGVEFQASMLHKNKEINFAGFSKQMILEMCILSGCDYLQSLSGLGLKRAHALITRFKSHDRVIKHLKYSTVSVPPLYEEAFKKAILTFKHQRVYDPKSEDIVHLFEISDELGCDLDFLGPLITQTIAKGIAEGNLDPLTKMPFQGENVSSQLIANVNSLPKSLEPGKQKRLELPVQKNLLTKYFCFASLEAKRKFMAPRVSPKCENQTDDSSGSPQEQVHVDSASREAEDMSASSSQSQKSDRFSPSSNFGEYGSATAVLENAQSSCVVNGPNELLADTTVRSNEDADYMSSVGEEERITKPDKAKVSVTSRYFQHKSCEEKIFTSPCLRDCSAMNKNRDPKSLTNESDASGVKESRKTTGKSSYFQQKEQSEDSEDDQFDNPLLNRSYFIDQSKNAKGTTKSESGKVVVRSKYFQQKPESKNNLSDEEEDFLVKKVSAVYTPKEAVHPSGIRSFEGSSGKRKSLLDDSFQKENMNPKHIRRTETHYDDDFSQNIPNVETNSEAKFGSNISHISNYSKIAEESVERFASAISSFRYNSSGSRASGLRAPLRNIHNSSSYRSSRELDLSKFVYNPSKSKPTARLPRF